MLNISNRLAKQILDQAKALQGTTLEILEQMVNTDSYSRDKQGVEKLFPLLEQEFCNLGFNMTRIPQNAYSDQCLARSECAKGKGNILLMGHLDTVFIPGSSSARPFTHDRKTDRLYGPGVADMKGGVAMTLGALRILKQLDLLSMPVEVLLTGDEELGSPVSVPVIEQAAGRAMACFNMEPGRPDGSVVIERKGSGHATMKINGRASHSGIAFDKGISANVELAHKILALHDLNDAESGINVNSGIISGGTTNNVVPENSEVHIHFAYKRTADGDLLIEKLRHIARNATLPETSAQLDARIGCLPMEQTRGNTALFEMVSGCAHLLNHSLKGAVTGGASDAGRISAANVPVVCAMGPVGGDCHTPCEYLDAGSIPFRMALLALSMIGVHQSYPEGSRKQ